MDPKALSHLDPKARETYDRIMGTATANDQPPADPNANTTATPTADNGFGASPSIFNNPSDATAPTHNFSAPANNNGFQTVAPTGLSDSPTPNPAPDPFGGLDVSNSTGNDSNSINQTGDAAASPSIFSASPTDPLSTPDAVQTNTAPASSSFFTNTSPADPAATPEPSVMPSFGPVEPPADPTTTPNDPLSPITPVPPYDPATGVPSPAAEASSFSEPLPSPAEVQAAAPHETSAVLKVIYIVGAVVFFAIYTIFWIKVFNLPFIF